MTNGNKNMSLMIVAILILIAAAFVGGIAITGNVDAESTPLVTLVLAMISSAIPAVLAYKKADETSEMLKNGHVPEKVAEGLALYDQKKRVEDSQGRGESDYGRQDV